MIDAFVKKDKKGKIMRRPRKDDQRYPDHNKDHNDTGMRRAVVSAEVIEMQDKAAHYRDQIMERKKGGKT